MLDNDRFGCLTNTDRFICMAFIRRASTDDRKWNERPTTESSLPSVARYS